MGLRGPGAKPIELRQLEGSASRVVAITTNDEFAKIPDEVTAPERKIWMRVVATFPPGYFKSADERHLAAYAAAAVRWLKAKQQIDLESEVIPTPFGPKKNPWLAVLKEAHEQMVQLGDRLGIGPSKRTMSVPASGAAKRKQAQARALLFSPVPKQSSSS